MTKILIWTILHFSKYHNVYKNKNFKLTTDEIKSFTLVPDKNEFLNLIPDKRKLFLKINFDANKRLN